MTHDVVAELDAWLRWYHPTAVRPSLWDGVRRARDEIVALRETVERQRLVLSKGHAETRDEALEEAARVVEDHFNPETCGPCAAAIRALKDKA